MNSERVARQPRNPFSLLAADFKALCLAQTMICSEDSKKKYTVAAGYLRNMRNRWFDSKGDLDAFSYQVAALVWWRVCKRRTQTRLKWKTVVNDRAVKYRPAARAFVEKWRDFLAEQLILGRDSTKTSFTKNAVSQSDTMGA